MRAAVRWSHAAYAASGAPYLTCYPSGYHGRFGSASEVFRVH